MQTLSVQSMARQLLDAAATTPHGRAAETVYGGRDRALRQTVLTLTAGSSLGEHASPGEATLLVLHGTVRLVTASDSWEGHAGDFAVVPPARHSLEAIDDAAVLLTVAVC